MDLYRITLWNPIDCMATGFTDSPRFSVECVWSWTGPWWRERPAWQVPGSLAFWGIPAEQGIHGPNGRYISERQANGWVRASRATSLASWKRARESKKRSFIRFYKYHCIMPHITMNAKKSIHDGSRHLQTHFRPKDATRNGSVGVRVLSKDRKEGVGPHAGPMYMI